MHRSTPTFVSLSPSYGNQLQSMFPGQDSQRGQYSPRFVIDLRSMSLTFSSSFPRNLACKTTLLSAITTCKCLSRRALPTTTSCQASPLAIYRTPLNNVSNLYAPSPIRMASYSLLIVLVRESQPAEHPLVRQFPYRFSTSVCPRVPQHSPLSLSGLSIAPKQCGIHYFISPHFNSPHLVSNQPVTSPFSRRPNTGCCKRRRILRYRSVSYSSLLLRVCVLCVCARSCSCVLVRASLAFAPAAYFNLSNSISTIFAPSLLDGADLHLEYDATVQTPTTGCHFFPHLRMRHATYNVGKYPCCLTECFKLQY